ncbi:UDP-N-acetylmuramoyl-tripeptide--D-alanyl-D-alanine ligase [Virgibacillus sp. 179-BFC.A HS]|uniref:UDP-N-acetylmuramoyl-tripeptide--D-alanyl-D-alanine ligase n=1 Tax=Tigheibacillus jepli TaxID=3035914 RepID=A0ABU5CHZ3_9BACI|nr:UDP-N-acetylmuramoyl-tripeptide--D-alanyl-D-alanine ligase [Virgibacillus sp. 179-BFC.A HS]MDY0405964.1 UDP-N-acetylmuramoyl-tripeptide--D-alanyl-D-alanine ligase [Virgibacillus sp. 179-BFC.A HS]
MMLFTTNWLATFFSEFRGKVTDSIHIKSVVTDSRKPGRQSLFVPLAGENFDGHDYLEQAVHNGAVAALWEKKKPLPAFLPTDFPVFFVSDTLTSLQQLAAAYRRRVNPLVIGITGSNGKTTTKDLVSAVVGKKYRTHFTKGNFNNHIGLPLTILSMPDHTEALVLEMGMNHFGEIDVLTKIAAPDFAIITNIGEAHIEFLGSRAGIAKAKLEIIHGLKKQGVFIYDGDEPLLQLKNYVHRTITCGFNTENDMVIRNTSIHEQQTTFQLSDENSYRIPLLGRHHAQNATYAITIGLELGIRPADIQDAFDKLHLTGMRFEMLPGKNGATIVNDAYNASPSAMRASIEVVKQLENYDEKVLVLGDMFELGDAAEKWHRQVAESIQAPITAVFTFGKDAQYISSEVKKRTPEIINMHFETKEALTEKLSEVLRPNMIVLFKASRGMHFESIVKELLDATNTTA